MCMNLSSVLQSHRQVKDMKPQRKQTRHDVIVVQGGQGMLVYIILCEFATAVFTLPYDWKST